MTSKAAQRIARLFGLARRQEYQHALEALKADIANVKATAAEAKAELVRLRREIRRLSESDLARAADTKTLRDQLCDEKDDIQALAKLDMIRAGDIKALHQQLHDQRIDVQALGQSDSIRASDIKKLGEQLHHRTSDIQALCQFDAIRAGDIRKLGEQLHHQRIDIQALGQSDSIRASDIKKLSEQLHDQRSDIEALGQSDSIRASDIKKLGEQLHDQRSDIGALGEADATRASDIRALDEQLRHQRNDIRALGELDATRTRDIEALIERTDLIRTPEISANSPLLEVKFGYPLSDVRRSAMKRLAQRAEMVRATLGCRPAMRLLLEGVGMTLNNVTGEQWAEPALSYHLGLLYAHLGDQERAAAELERSQTWPSSGGDLIYSDHLAKSAMLRAEQLAAIARGTPAILIASMPKSGSASLAGTLAKSLRAVQLRVSAGHFGDSGYTLVPHWLHCFLDGGAVAHDHFDASPFNGAVLRHAGVSRLFVLVRDPRAAALSLIQQSGIGRQRPQGRALERMIIDAATNRYLPWLRDWIAFSSQSDCRVQWLFFKDLRSNIGETIQLILRTLEADCPSLAVYRDLPLLEARYNFAAGDDDTWRRHMGPAGKKHLWNAMPAQVIELLQLEP